LRLIQPAIAATKLSIPPIKSEIGAPKRENTITGKYCSTPTSASRKALCVSSRTSHASAANLLTRYLAALWQQPNYDCWEEFPDRIAVSTLAALYAGLHAISAVFEADGQSTVLSTSIASQIKACTLSAGAYAGHLIKQIDGEDVVDASLLWACVPFQEHGLLPLSEPVMQATVTRIERDLLGRSGGVHRYSADTFYGGGEWILLTALLGEYYAAVGNLAAARRCLASIEAHADEQGYLPEQDISAPLAPAYVELWQTRWGSVARPLTWSHAAYLGLSTLLHNSN
jgi:GH15 family glucan-1,4-alpha-glucosidase